MMAAGKRRLYWGPWQTGLSIAVLPRGGDVRQDERHKGSCPAHPPKGVFLGVIPDSRSFGKLRTGAGALPPSTGSGQALLKRRQERAYLTVEMGSGRPTGRTHPSAQGCFSGGSPRPPPLRQAQDRRRGAAPFDRLRAGSFGNPIRESLSDGGDGLGTPYRTHPLVRPRVFFWGFPQTPAPSASSGQAPGRCPLRQAQGRLFWKPDEREPIDVRDGLGTPYRTHPPVRHVSGLYAGGFGGCPPRVNF